MNHRVLKHILEMIRKNAIHGAGMASDYGTFEQAVPEQLKNMKNTTVIKQTEEIQQKRRP